MLAQASSPPRLLLLPFPGSSGASLGALEELEGHELEALALKPGGGGGGGWGGGQQV